MVDKSPSRAGLLRALHASAGRANTDVGVSGADSMSSSSTDVSIIGTCDNTSGADGISHSGAADPRLDF